MERKVLVVYGKKMKGMRKLAKGSGCLVAWLVVSLRWFFVWLSGYLGLCCMSVLGKWLFSYHDASMSSYIYYFCFSWLSILLSTFSPAPQRSNISLLC